MSYILFTADFDEGDSTVKHFDTIEQLADEMDGYCCECNRKTEAFENLVKHGHRKDEWHEYHLLKVGDDE